MLNQISNLPCRTSVNEGGAMSKRNWKDMRGFLDFLKDKDDIIYIAEEVDPEWEINGFTRTMCQMQGPALYFRK